MQDAAVGVWPWLWVALAALVVGLCIELVMRKRTSRSAAVIRGVVAMAIVPMVFYGIQRLVELPERRVQEEREERSVELLNDLVARLGNREAAEELIRLRAEALFASSKGDAEQFVNDLLEQLPEQVETHQALRGDSEDTALRLRLQWEPIVLFVAQEFDNRVSELARSGFPSAIETLEPQIVRLGPTPRSPRVLRSAQIAGGYKLELLFMPGSVDLGEPRDPFSFWLIGSAKNEGPREFFQVSLEAARIRWSVMLEGEDTIHSEEDFGARVASRFPEMIEEQLNRAFHLAVVEGSTG